MVDANVQSGKPRDPTRRAVTALLSSSVAIAAPASAEAGARKRTFVLVHGAWHGGWCWTRVADRLRRAGHEVYAPTLTGLGERSHLIRPEIDLQTHIHDVVNEILWKDLSSVVLVGHSYGGMVITGASNEILDKIASIVYVDAFVPKSGQSVNDLGSIIARSGGQPIPPPPAIAFGVNRRDVEWVQSKLTAQPFATFSQPLMHSENFERIRRKTYISATARPGSPFVAAKARLSVDPSWTLHHVESGHDVMIDAPEELSQLLLGAA